MCCKVGRQRGAPPSTGLTRRRVRRARAEQTTAPALRLGPRLQLHGPACCSSVLSLSVDRTFSSARPLVSSASVTWVLSCRGCYAPFGPCPASGDSLCLEPLRGRSRGSAWTDEWMRGGLRASAGCSPSFLFYGLRPTYGPGWQLGSPHRPASFPSNKAPGSGLSSGRAVGFVSVGFVSVLHLRRGVSGQEGGSLDQEWWGCAQGGPVVS